MRRWPLAVLLVLALAGCATQRLQGFVEPEVERIAFTDWDYAELRGGWTAETLIGAEVLGPTGEEIGEVEDLVIGPDGLVRSVIIDTSEGFLDLGGARASVPWRQVEMVGPDLETVSVPVTRANLGDFGLFRDRQAVAAGPRTWRASELLNDYVRLAGGIEYGWVEDLVFQPNGELAAVVVAPDFAYGVGPYAFPFNDLGFDPGSDVLDLPYAYDDIGTRTPFDSSVL